MDKTSRRSSSMEQAIVSRNTEYLYKFLCFGEEAQKQMVAEVSCSQVLPLLEMLAGMFEKKDMRYECVQAMRNVLLWRKDMLKTLHVDAKEDTGRNMHAENMETLKRVLAVMHREKIDLNKIYELRGRIAYLRETLSNRKQEKENVPICKEK
ncbi:hypothetical protein NECID01_1907 [Nematocida sp. AWRm77]|nr:hypothetical protein NECID01_1907 [Nematocida sp. AWRm77]